MNIKNLCWWFGYTVTAIWMQKFFPGLDALLPGFIICLQEENRQQTLFYLLICMVIQEGTGMLPFGGSLLWYSLTVMFFYAGSRFFMAGNLVFVAILAASLGVGKIFLISGMEALQTFPLARQQIVFEVISQIILTPLLWVLATATRGKILKNANKF